MKNMYLNCLFKQSLKRAILAFNPNPHNNQLPVGLIAQLVEHCTGPGSQRSGLESHSGLPCYYIHK